MSGYDDGGMGELGEAVDEACAPVLDEAVAPHLPAIRAALHDLDPTGRPTAAEIIERMRLNGLVDPETPE